jgi:hypothetical protein
MRAESKKKKKCEDTRSKENNLVFLTRVTGEQDRSHGVDDEVLDGDDVSWVLRKEFVGAFKITFLGMDSRSVTSFRSKK